MSTPRLACMRQGTTDRSPTGAAHTRVRHSVSTRRRFWLHLRGSSTGRPAAKATRRATIGSRQTRRQFHLRSCAWPLKTSSPPHPVAATIAATRTQSHRECAARLIGKAYHTTCGLSWDAECAFRDRAPGNMTLSTAITSARPTHGRSLIAENRPHWWCPRSVATQPASVHDIDISTIRASPAHGAASGGTDGQEAL